jgi:micrococcal nuclease
MKIKNLKSEKVWKVCLGILVVAIIFILGIFAGLIIAKYKNNNGGASGNIEKSFAISPKDSKLVKVIRVIDGDTIEIEGGERVRYIGIDTPETVDPRKPVQCFGVEASKKNKELVEGKMVRLEKDVTDRDKYNRLLRYIWLDDVLINKKLVEEGFAHSYSYPPDVKYQSLFVQAEKEAREGKIGLWQACPVGASVTSQSTTVGSEKAVLSSTASNLPKDDSCVIKGNISTSGEKVYHMPGCGSYTKTQIDESRGERWFCSEAEAQSAGWRKALNCN